MVCEHEHMNVDPLNYRTGYAIVVEILCLL